MAKGGKTNEQMKKLGLVGNGPNATIGDHDTARVDDLIKKASEIAPEDAFIMDSLGWVEFRRGNAAEAARILRAAWQARPDAEIAAHLGEVLWAQGLRDEAGQIWREGLMLKANNETLQETIKRLGFKP